MPLGLFESPLLFPLLQLKSPDRLQAFSKCTDWHRGNDLLQVFSVGVDRPEFARLAAFEDRRANVTDNPIGQRQLQLLDRFRDGREVSSCHEDKRDAIVL